MMMHGFAKLIFKKSRKPINTACSKVQSKTVKVKVTLVQALRLCTGCTAHRGSRRIALLFYEHGLLKKVMGQRHAPAALYLGKDPVPIVQKAGWAPEPVQLRKISPPAGFEPQTVQPVAQLLYRLIYPAHKAQSNLMLNRKVNIASIVL
jgi:hypothetical protein